MPVDTGNSDAITDSEIIAFAQLATIFPRTLVDDALEQTERYSCKLRELPHNMMFYFPMVMALHRDESAEEVLRSVLECDSKVFGRRTDKITGKGGISNARIRVSWEPLKLVFDKVAKPLAAPGTPGCFIAKRRIMACDGVLINVPDNTANDGHFGRATNQHEQSGAYPQARVVALVECGTHAIVKAEVGGYKNSEVTLAKTVLSALDESMMCLTDRLFFGWELFNLANNTGAKLVWRIKKIDKEKLQIRTKLPDGSFQAIYHPPEKHIANSKKSGEPAPEPIAVRVLTFSVQGATQEPIHLITTFLDEDEVSAIDLAKLYRERWEIESVFKELKVELNNNRASLRSKTPDLVKQELYGLMMAHFAIRSLMYEAAARANLDPDVLSFKGAVHTVQRKSLRSDSFSP